MKETDRIAVLYWWAYAVGDLKEVRLNRAHGGEPQIACFHAQQAAEKALKALLIAYRIRPPRTHVLDALREVLPDTASVKSAFQRLDSLTAWAVVARYPELPNRPTDQDAEDALRLAQAVCDKVREDLVALGVSPPA